CVKQKCQAPLFHRASVEARRWTVRRRPVKQKCQAPLFHGPVPAADRCPLWQTPGPMPRDLQPLFAPRSVAILGASNDPAKGGNWLRRARLKGTHRRPVYLINRNGGEVLGEPAYRSLAELPGDPELVVIAVPAPAFEQAVDDSLARNARALIGITAGLGESG